MVSTLPAFSALAEETFDVTFRTGAAFGSLTFLDDNDQQVTGSFGGIPLGAMWNRGLSRTASLRLGGGVLLDLKNSQLIKQGIAAGFAWHVLGGPRRFSREGATAGFVTTSQSSVSIITYGGLQNFAATDAENTKTKVAGSVFEVDLGLEYRYDFTDVTAATIELASSIYTLPASVSRIKPATYELIFGWRSFI